MVKICPQSSGKLILYLNLISELGSLVYYCLGLSELSLFMAVFTHLLPSPNTMISLLIWTFILLDFRNSWPLVLTCSHITCQIMPFFTFLFWSISHRAMITCHTFLFFIFLLRVTENDQLVMSTCRVFSCVWKRVFVMTSAFSFCPPRPNLPVTPGIPLLPTFALQSPKMKRTSFMSVSSKRSVGLHRTIQLQLLQRYWLGHRLGLLWYWMVCLGNEQRSFCCF